MRYSKFLPELGLYEVYEDQSRVEMNADLPVPRLTGRVGNIGIPASHAGRSLPSAAKLVGRRWQPEGQIVMSRRAGALGAGGETLSAHPVLLIGVAVVAIWGLSRLYVSTMQSWGDR